MAQLVRGQARSRRSGGEGTAGAFRVALFLALSLAFYLPSQLAFAEDRQDELEELREAIQDSRERVTEHEADERAFLEQLEEVDRRLQAVAFDRNVARRELETSREKLSQIEPRREAAAAVLEKTQKALASRAVALYRGGEVGPLRVLFSAESLPDMLSRASALRLLVRHDAELVERHAKERDALELLRAEAARTIAEREKATATLSRLAGELANERKSKRMILASVRDDRKTERRLLLELEQAAQALEETIRTLGRRSAEAGGSAGGGLTARKGALRPPVEGPVSEPFGRVIDPEYQTSTFRNGVEFAAPAGTRVRAVATGVVRFAGWFRGYGRIVIVDHGDDFHTISGHLDEIRVEVGDKVSEKEVIGTVGETGSLGGPSLYFEVRQAGDPVDPEEWLQDSRG